MLIQVVLRQAVIPSVSKASISDVCAGVCAVSEAARKETIFSASEPTVKGISFSVEEPRQLIQGQCYSVFYVFQLLSGLTKNICLLFLSVETISEIPDCPGCSCPVLASSANVDSASEL